MWYLLAKFYDNFWPVRCSKGGIFLTSFNIVPINSGLRRAGYKLNIFYLKNEFMIFAAVAA